MRLEMQPDMLVSLLSMFVEPSDSSYMPSLVTVSAGSSVDSLHELRTVTVEPTDRRVVLLDNLSQVHCTPPHIDSLHHYTHLTASFPGQPE